MYIKMRLLSILSMMALIASSFAIPTCSSIVSEYGACTDPLQYDCCVQGTQCFQKDSFYAQCLQECVTGLEWSCNVLSSTPSAPAPAPQPAPGQFVTACVNSPCQCDSAEAGFEDPLCEVCHSNGCNQCEAGSFKKDYNYPCVDCQSTFGRGCLQCQDFNGCGQCDSGYTRVQDAGGLWYCSEESSVPTHPPTSGPGFCSEDLDIMFILDESGSVGSTNFELVKEFVVEEVTNEISVGSNVGVISYATSRLIDWSLGDPQTPRTGLVNKVNGLTFSSGGTATREALELAIGNYAVNDDPSKGNLLILVTDGVPSSEVCSVKPALDAAGIKVLVVVVGSFSTSSVACLVDNTATDMILMSNFNEFADINIPCPQNLPYQCTRVGGSQSAVIYQTCSSVIES